MCNFKLLKNSNINGVKINITIWNTSKPTGNVTKMLQLYNKCEIFKNCIEKL